MAKKTRNKLGEVAVENEPSVFVSIKVKDLPASVRDRHMARKKKQDALRKQQDKLFKEGEKDIEKLVKGIKDAKGV